jgi:hypothetical protein
MFPHEPTWARRPVAPEGEEEDYFFSEDLFMSIISKIDFFFIFLSVLFSLYLNF